MPKKITWKEANNRTRRILKRYFIFGKVSWDIAKVGGLFWMGLVVLGLYSPTYSIWTFVIGIVGSYLIVDRIMATFIQVRRKRAFTPFSKKPLSPTKAYLLFIALILFTAVVADQFATAILGTTQQALGSLLSVVFWSVLLSGVLSTVLLESYGETTTFRIADQLGRPSPPETAHEPAQGE